MSKIINPKAEYIAIENFSLNDYHIVLNGSDTFVKSVEFKKDDEISTSSQSGSLGDIWKITNLRTNETAKFWSYDYYNEDDHYIVFQPEDKNNILVN